jgi:serine/threonine protein kinase
MQGEVLRGGRYVVTRTLGEGSQGSTFEAVDKKDGRLVAVKRFDVRGAKAWKDVELAEREARVLASLAHPHLPAYIEHFEEDGRLYLVMERIEGTSLAEGLKKGERFTEEEARRFLADASETLAYLHAQGVVHRDLKPGNVIQRGDGSFAFVDFGAVRDRMKPEGGSTVVGTFGYMAPEQFQGRAVPASDVYAVGATCLAMVTGMQPEELPHRGLAIDVAGALRGRASEGLVSALARMLDPDPDRRASRVELPQESRVSRDMRRDRDVTRRARKEARRQARRERRAQRWQRRRRRHPPVPILFVMLLALALARVVVSLVMFVAVPLLLGLLSLVFGRGLREAAQRVRVAGGRAYDALDRAAQHQQGDPDDARVRVEPLRDEPWDDEDEASEDEARRGRR